MAFIGRILGLSSNEYKDGEEKRVLEEKGEPDENFVSCDEPNDLSEKEEVSEEETDNENEENTNFLNLLIDKDDYCEFYKTDAQTFVKNVKIWAGQRDLNKEHIIYLAKQIRKEKYIMGTFTLVRSDDGTVVLVNGHHRVRALKKIFKLQPSFNCNIRIELYKTDRLESQKTFNLFRNSNTILNVKVEDMPNKYALSLLDKLTTRFDGIFRDKAIDEVCNRPYIHKRLLFSKLKQAFEKYDIDEDCLFNSIIEFNDKLRRKEYPKCTLKSKGKCIETGCYLGLKEKCSWLDKLLETYS